MEGGRDGESNKSSCRSSEKLWDLTRASKICCFLAAEKPRMERSLARMSRAGLDRLRSLDSVIGVSRVSSFSEGVRDVLSS